MNYKQEFEDTMVELLKKAWHEGEAEGIRRAEAEYNKGLSNAWECARKIGNNSWTGLTYEIGFKDLDSSINASWDCVMKYSASEAIEKIKEWEEKQKECFPEGNPFISKQDDTERSCSTCADSDKKCNDHNLHCNYSCWTPKQDDTKSENNAIYECSCGYGWDKTNAANVRFHFCPNCGKAVGEKKQDDTEIRVGDEVIYYRDNKTKVTAIAVGVHHNNGWYLFDENKKVVIGSMPSISLRKTGRHYDIESILKQMQEGEE